MKSKFNKFVIKEKTRDLLLDDQNVLSYLLNFILDGYRKLLVKKTYYDRFFLNI